MGKTGLAYCEECLLHDAGPDHPERPERLTAILEAIEETKKSNPGSLDLLDIEVEPASPEDLLRVHRPEHIETIRCTCMTGNVYPDPDTSMVEASWGSALLAAGAGISAAKAVLDGQVRNAFCAVRPPGHHARPDRAMGFCLFNNVAVAARWLREVARLKKVAILDWDVHHGNGTQEVFYDDPTVCYVSIHQYPHYPGTGLPEERGAQNTNLNILMPRGAPPEAWTEAIQDEVLPEFERFQPDFLLISCGFDGHALDPLGGQLLQAEHYAEMTRLVKEVAGGRVVSILEGGYHLHALAESALAHLRTLNSR